MKTLAAVLASAGVAFLGCSASADNTSAEAAEGTPSISADQLVDAPGPATVMRVTIRGGPRAGTYEKTSADPTCTVGFAEEGAWGNAASDIEDSEGLTGIDLIVPDPAAAVEGTRDFLFTAYFDERTDESNRIHIEPAKGTGSGTVRIEDRGRSGRVSMSGQTGDGVGVEATIDCKQIIRSE